MYLTRLSLEGLRNLDPVSLTFHPRLNLVYGENGSGKTSLLEAIWLLGRGRSFRTRHLSAAINNENPGFVVSGRVAASNDETLQLGVSRDKRGNFQCRIDRNPVTSSSQLAEALPLLLINSDSFQLVEGGPGNRRRYLDWLVFHVEHNSRPVWKAFNQVIKQRNSLLRRGKIDASEMEYWNQQFVELSEKVNNYRLKIWEDVLVQIEQTLNEMDGVNGLVFDFECGWDKSSPLIQQLQNAADREKQYGASLLGPHRSDIRIRYKGRLAREQLSRGQMKILACAMQVAQANIYHTRTGSNPVVLLDDLPAELDVRHRGLVVDSLMLAEAQVFATGVVLEELSMGFCDREITQEKAAVFHVEHGVIVADKG